MRGSIFDRPEGVKIRPLTTEEVKAAGFKLYLETDIKGFDISSARIVQVPPW